MSSGTRLPVLSLALTSGAVDGFTFLALGQVFTSNMTGNLVLLGLSAGHGRLSEAVGSLVALVAFICGLVVAFRFIGPATGWAARTRLAVGAELCLLAVLATGWAASWPQLPLVAIAALAMGGQSAVTHRLRTFVGSTTFITGALTVSISRQLAPGTGPPHLFELAAVLLTLALGAAAAALCVHLLPVAAPLVAVLGAAVTVVSSLFVRGR
ncbi:YoaK family protein [Nonomuraea sp. KM90]|uniref:YoaK family protein n=1 Tax=Nonomuraea sp. KM90 TaxID=3457428 RepID=UPI003FCCB6B3